MNYISNILWIYLEYIWSILKSILHFGKGYAIYYSRHIQNSGIFRTLFIQVYAGIFKYIETLLSIIKAFWLIQQLVYPHIFNSQPCHIPNPGIFRTGGKLKTLWNFDQAYSDLCHNQNSLNSGIILPKSGIFRNLHNTWICRNLANLKSWNIQNPSIIASWHVFRTSIYFQKKKNYV